MEKTRNGKRPCFSSSLVIFEVDFGVGGGWGEGGVTSLVTYKVALSWEVAFLVGAVRSGVCRRIMLLPG
eukprot:1442306-Amphidinium_carterae.1